MTNFNDYKFDVVLCTLEGQILTNLTPEPIPFTLAAHISNAIYNSGAIAENRVVALVQTIDVPPAELAGQ